MHDDAKLMISSHWFIILWVRVGGYVLDLKLYSCGRRVTVSKRPDHGVVFEIFSYTTQSGGGRWCAKR